MICRADIALRTLALAAVSALQVRYPRRARRAGLTAADGYFSGFHDRSGLRPLAGRARRAGSIGRTRVSSAKALGQQEQRKKNDVIGHTSARSTYGQ